jgi:cytochrome c554/c'-like protein
MDCIGRASLLGLFLALLALKMISAQETTRHLPPCAACHVEGKTQPETSMAHALEAVSDPGLLARLPLLTFNQGGYSYRIERRGEQSIYTVTNEKETLSLPIGWAVGAGRLGQTYVLEKDGVLYESRVSYFSNIKGLDITIGHTTIPPRTILAAMGRVIDADESIRCFGCHATGSGDGKQLTLEKMSPGVACVHCHAAAPRHLTGMAEGELHLDEMKKLANMSAEDASHFCGQCHRTLEEILTLNKTDVTSLRFQPYRLGLSKCYDPDDRRISCVTCHDPHVELVTDPAHYDSKCLACHGGGKVGAQPCKISKKDCANCHMPKLEVPGSHHRFSDHRIRIVKDASRVKTRAAAKQ